MSEYFNDLKMPGRRDLDKVDPITLRIQQLQTEIIATQQDFLLQYSVIVAARNQEPGDPQLETLLNSASSLRDAFPQIISDYDQVIAAWAALVKKRLEAGGRDARGNVMFWQFTAAFMSQYPQLVAQADQLRINARVSLETIKSILQQAQAQVEVDEAYKAAALASMAGAIQNNSEALEMSADATQSLAQGLQQLNNDQPVPDPVVQRDVNNAMSLTSSVMEKTELAITQVDDAKESLTLARFSPDDFLQTATGKPETKNAPLLLAAAAAAGFFLLS
jgi:hypothetical protein